MSNFIDAITESFSELSTETTELKLCTKCSKNGVKVSSTAKMHETVLCEDCLKKASGKMEKIASGKTLLEGDAHIVKQIRSKDDLTSYTTISVEKHEKFIHSPLENDLTSIPGIGPAALESLNSAGITNTFELFGKYLLGFGDRTKSRPEQFKTFLSQFSKIGRSRDTIVRAVSEKVFIAFGSA